MLTKRFFLIAGGTVTGLGAVLSITPPQFGSTTGLALGSGKPLSGGTISTPAATPATTPSTTPAITPVATPTPAPSQTKKPASGGTTTPKKTHKPTPKKTRKPTPVSTPASTPTPVTTTTAAGVNGTFTGATASTIYGPVQVQVTIVNGKITNAVALMYPTRDFRSQQINQQAIPYLIQETLAAQSANIQGVGGASFTSTGWAASLSSALAKARM